MLAFFAVLKISASKNVEFNQAFKMHSLQSYNTHNHHMKAPVQHELDEPIMTTTTFSQF